MSRASLGNDSLLDRINKGYVLRILLVVSVVSGLIIGFVLYHQGSKSDISDHSEFSVQYGELGILVEQINGKPIDSNLEMRITYVDGSSETIDMGFNELNDETIIKPMKNIESVNSIYINWTGEREDRVLRKEDVPSEIDADNIDINIDDIEAYVREPIELRASDYVDSETDIVNYNWDFGQGDTSVQESVTFAYNSSGTYLAELSATDEIGNSEKTVFEVSVEKPNLITSFDVPESVNLGHSIVLNGSDYTSPSVVDYKWQIGDVEYVERPKFNYTPAEKGAKNVTLTVRNKYGYEVSESRQVSVVKSNSEDLSLNVAKLDKKLFSFSVTIPRGDELVGYGWDFGDGNTRNTLENNVDYQYSQTGQFNVQVIAQTESGDTMTASKTVEVSPEPENPSTVTINMDYKSGFAWYVDSIEGANISEVLPRNELGDYNPNIYLDTGKTYIFKNLTREHPLEFRDTFGNVILSQSTNPRMEKIREVNWSENNSSVRFTLTEGLAQRVSGYHSSNSRTMNGRILVNYRSRT